MNKTLVVIASLASFAAANVAGRMPNQEWDMSNINKWINPDILVAIILVLSLFLLFLTIACQMMAIQSQEFFVDKSINWGKVEEVE
mgnify:FL=1